jgi:hypothetical protein
MIEDGVTYTVEVYTDDNSPTAPGSVKAFRVAATSTAAGLDVTFDPSTASQVTGAAPP